MPLPNWTKRETDVGPTARGCACGVSQALGKPEAEIRVTHVPGPGCYGHNGADDVALDACLLALEAPGRPVRVQWMREDEFIQEPLGTPMVVDIRATLNAGKRLGGVALVSLGNALGASGSSPRRSHATGGLGA